MLKQYGVFIGSDLNEAYDNLLFTRMFKNPSWFVNRVDGDIKRRIEVFIDAHKAEKLDKEVRLYLKNVIKTNKLIESNFWYNPLQKNNKNSPFLAWKEPNSWIFIKSFLESISSLKYIHMVRDPLYMMQSTNKQQLRNWSSALFGYDSSWAQNNMELAQLHYWLDCNEEVLSLSKGNLQDRIMILSYDRFCQEPKKYISILFKYCGLDLTEEQLSEYAGLTMYTTKELSNIIPIDLQERVDRILQCLL